MGWETRKAGKRYYTKSRREGGCVVREYVGTGRAAEVVARLDREERLAREAREREKLQEIAEWDAMDHELADIGSLIDAVASAILTTSGCYRHKGEWRRKRGQRQAGKAKHTDRGHR